MVGDLEANISHLKTQLRQARFPVHELDAQGVARGRPGAFLPVLHYIFIRYSQLFCKYVRDHGFELRAKSDLRFLEGVYRLLRDHLGYSPVLSTSQFFSNGFAERKVLFCRDVLEIAKRIHEELRAAEGPGGSMAFRRASPRRQPDATGAQPALSHNYHQSGGGAAPGDAQQGRGNAHDHLDRTVCHAEGNAYEAAPDIDYDEVLDVSLKYRPALCTDNGESSSEYTADASRRQEQPDGGRGDYAGDLRDQHEYGVGGALHRQDQQRYVHADLMFGQDEQQYPTGDLHLSQDEHHSGSDELLSSYVFGHEPESGRESCVGEPQTPPRPFPLESFPAVAEVCSLQAVDTTGSLRDLLDDIRAKLQRRFETLERRLDQHAETCDARTALLEADVRILSAKLNEVHKSSQSSTPAHRNDDEHREAVIQSATTVSVPFAPRAQEDQMPWMSQPTVLLEQAVGSDAISHGTTASVIAVDMSRRTQYEEEGGNPTEVPRSNEPHLSSMTTLRLGDGDTKALIDKLTAKFKDTQALLSRAQEKIHQSVGHTEIEPGSNDAMPPTRQISSGSRASRFNSGSTFACPQGTANNLARTDAAPQRGGFQSPKYTAPGSHYTSMFDPSMSPSGWSPMSTTQVLPAGRRSSMVAD